jgi:hypothetical protein
LSQSPFAKHAATAVVPDQVDVFGLLNYTPSERQQAFHEASRQKIDGILYGGAAGGGKTAAFIMEALWLAANLPRNSHWLLPALDPELEESFLNELARRQFARPLGATWNATNKVSEVSQ